MSGIKSDRWIRSKCVLQDVYVQELPEGEIKQLPFICGPNDAKTWSRDSGQTVRLATAEEHYTKFGNPYPMISPFESGQVRTRQLESYWTYPDGPNQPGEEEKREEKIISYGTSSYGYDIRCAPEFKVFTNVYGATVDPKNFNDKAFVDMNQEYCDIPPNSFALARSLEYFRIPRDILVICLGKSTYARCGIIVNVTPLEPEWEGHITLEFSNTTPLPARIYANEGCAQLLFFQSDKDDVCATSYKDRNGKYQGQRGVTLPKS